MILVLDDVSHGIVNCVFVTMQARTLWSVSRCPETGQGSAWEKRKHVVLCVEAVRISRIHVQPRLRHSQKRTTTWQNEEKSQEPNPEDNNVSANIKHVEKALAALDQNDVFVFNDVRAALSEQPQQSRLEA